MHKAVRAIAMTLLLTATTVACAKVPITGRRQFNLIPDVIMQQIGASTYRDTLSEEKVLKNTDDSSEIKKVGQRIAKVTGEKSYDWEYKLIKDSDTVNAW